VEHRAGFVYILSNSAMPGMVKIGLTRNEAAARAVELSRATGVPTDFELVYDELVNDCRAVERSLHKRFSEYRVNDRREFFRVPIRQAIAALQEEAKAYPVIPLAEERIDILPRLEHLNDRETQRLDLGFIYSGDEPDFSSSKLSQSRITPSDSSISTRTLFTW
jgi:hypothetical protein